MRDDPGLDLEAIRVTLATRYQIVVTSSEFLHLGYDLGAFVYRVSSELGGEYFLKIRTDGFNAAALELTYALRQAEIDSVLAPLPAIDGSLSTYLDNFPGLNIALYPFIHGENAVANGLTPDQWRHFGRTLAAVHDSGLESTFGATLRNEEITLPSATLAEQVLTLAKSIQGGDDPQSRLATFYRERESTICSLIDRARALGRILQSTSFQHVICHGDIHAANILVGGDGRIWLVDWEAPLLAPRERDLLFVIGSRIARRVEPEEENYFFEGYGNVKIDRNALIYFRYERLIEDIGEIGRSVLWNPSQSVESLNAEVELALTFFAPGGDVELVEKTNTI